MNQPTATAVWVACPAEDGEHWLLPWEPVFGQWQHPLIAPLLAEEAHDMARKMRTVFPGHLFAVRPLSAGEPLWPEAMVDHYDLPPYA